MGRARKKVRKSAKEKSFLPNEIITNILIRLPIKSLIRFGLVCKKWRDITLARDFMDIHLKSSIPVILDTTSSNDSQLDLLVLDKWWAFPRTSFKINTFLFNSGHVLLSHAGLIVLGGFPSKKPEFIILNPARPSQECVKITLCEELQEMNICAVYYHPSLKVYCTLWRIEKSCPICHGSESDEYKLLNLGSKPSLKMIKNPCNVELKDEDAKGVFIKSYIYWMVMHGHECIYSGCNDILEFDVISEEFKVMPCPVPKNTECKHHQSHLLNSDGNLSYVLVLPSKITIWRLDDRARQVWTSIEYTLNIPICKDTEEVGVIAVVNGVLAFELNRRLFVCNLSEGTVKNYPKRNYGRYVPFQSHQMSLASLKNCKSTLFINEEGEVLTY